MKKLLVIAALGAVAAATGCSSDAYESGEAASEASDTVLASIETKDGAVFEFLETDDGVTLSADFPPGAVSERSFADALQTDGSMVAIYEAISGEDAPEALLLAVERTSSSGIELSDPDEVTVAFVSFDQHDADVVIPMTTGSDFQQDYCASNNYAPHPGVSTQFDSCRLYRTDDNSYSEYVKMMTSYVQPYRGTVTHYQMRKVLGGYESEHSTSVLEGHTHYYYTSRTPRRTIKMGVSHADGDGYHVSYFGRTSPAAFTHHNNWY